MIADEATSRGRPYLLGIHVENFRVLRSVTLTRLDPLTVVFGPNGSGKSTLLDVLVFLAEAIDAGLRQALHRRGGLRELRSRGESGPVVIELTYRESQDVAGHPAVLVYRVEIDESAGRPVVQRERLTRSHRELSGQEPLLDVVSGVGRVRGPGANETENVELAGSDLLAVAALGQLRQHPQAVELRDYLSGWRVFTAGSATLGRSEHGGLDAALDSDGANLPNVVAFLKANHPSRWETVMTILRERVPHVRDIEVVGIDGTQPRLTLRDDAFEEAVSAEAASQGTLKLLAQLCLIIGTQQAAVLGLEEPENNLHPKLMWPLAEDLRSLSAQAQVVVSTHSPYLVDALHPNELWLLYRDERGFTSVTRASDSPRITAMSAEGGLLGDLWMEGWFGAGDPLTNGGLPR